MATRNSQAWHSVPTLPSASRGLSEDFFGIDDIIAGQGRVPCLVELPLYRLGFLNSNSKEEHLLPGTKLELPLWLARGLCTRRRQIVSVTLPKEYSKRKRTILSADANVVNLHNKGPYYYSMGVKLLYFNFSDGAELASSLLETFLNRFRRIMDTSQNAYQSDTAVLTLYLDEMERHLFSQGQQALNQHVSWEKGLSHVIKPSLLIDGNRKRKRCDGQDVET